METALALPAGLFEAVTAKPLEKGTAAKAASADRRRVHKRGS